MQSIPVSSPLMLMFATPIEADRPASPLKLEGDEAEFSSIFAEIVSTRSPGLEQVGRTPLMADYGKNLPLNLTEGDVLGIESAELKTNDTVISEQESIEDMALLLAQFGYVVTTDQNTNAVVKTATEAAVVGATVAGATDAETANAISNPELLDTSDGELDETETSALTADQVILAEQQQGEPQVNLSPPSESTQRQVRQAIATPPSGASSNPLTSNPMTDEMSEQLKSVSQQPVEDSVKELGDDSFLKAGLVNKDTSPNTPTSLNTALSVATASTVDATTNTQQPTQAQIANLQVGQTSSLNNLTPTTQLTASQGFAAAALSQEVLDMDLDARQWGNTLSQRIVTMVTDDVQQARIQLDPPELGSLQVRLQIQNDQATIHVQVQHGHVREALESNAFRLRDALASEGIELDSFDVESEDQQQGNLQQQADSQAEEQPQGQSQGQSNIAAAEHLTDTETAEWLTMDEEGSQRQRVNSSVNLLDTFA